MLCFDLILGPFCIYVQKLSGRAKTFRLAMPTRQRAFSDSAPDTTRLKKFSGWSQSFPWFDDCDVGHGSRAVR